MSEIAERIGDRYDAISRYFKDNWFGETPTDLSTLSALPPVDRCLIIERVFQNGKCDFLVCIDKLSMAYLKAGWRDIALEFLEKCEVAGWMHGNYDHFVEKIEGLTVTNVSRDYADALQKIAEGYSETQFPKLIKELCENYSGNEILSGEETDTQLADFIRERRYFIDDMTQKDDAALVVPKEGSGSEVGFTLANSQVIAFCYLLGGARITHFKFMTSDALPEMDETSRKLWEETEAEVSRFSPYPYASRRQGGERAYLVSVEFPCYDNWNYQYRTSGQSIDINDVVDLMHEVMDVMPRAKRAIRVNGEKYFRFSWMFLQEDVDRLLAIFPSVEYEYGNWVQMRTVFGDMDWILNSIARKALQAYPFMGCEFTGW